MRNWIVELQAPAINEKVMVTAENEEEAIEAAVHSTVERMLNAGEATARAVPKPPEAGA